MDRAKKGKKDAQKKVRLFVGTLTTQNSEILRSKIDFFAFFFVLRLWWHNKVQGRQGKTAWVDSACKFNRERPPGLIQHVLTYGAEFYTSHTPHP